MGINGINSYGMGFYNYQSSINNIRLTQALSNNSKLSQYASSPVSSVKNSFESSMSFVKKYTSSMSSLLGAASVLKTSNHSGAMKDLAVTSSDESIATAEAKFALRNAQDIQLDVKQLAQAQSNVSNSVKASDMAQADMNFTVNAGMGSVDVKISSANADGTSKTNVQMLREAADKINSSSYANVKANVIQKDGNVSLELTGKSTGTDSAFFVSGDLGAAAGIDTAKTTASNALYSVTTNGKTTNYESSRNDVTVDFTRIGVNLKGVGKTTIKADVDVEKLSSAVSDLVDSYNASLKLLNDNYDRGTGVEKQLRNLVAGLGSEQSLEKLGITVNKDATLNFDKTVLAKSMKEDPKLTKNLISGPGGLADKAFNKATNGINTNSSSLINGDIESMKADSISSPYNVFSMYSRSGAYTMSNYYAVGMMMNYLA